VELLGGQTGKTVVQVKAHLVPENGQGAHAGAVGLGNAVIQDVLDQVQVLLHAYFSCGLILRQDCLNIAKVGIWESGPGKGGRLTEYGWNFMFLHCAT